MLDGRRVHGQIEDGLLDPTVRVRNQPATGNPAGRKHQRVRPDPELADRRGCGDGDHPVSLDIHPDDGFAQLDPTPIPAESGAQRLEEADTRDARWDERDLERFEGQPASGSFEDRRVIVEPKKPPAARSCRAAGHTSSVDCPSDRVEGGIAPGGLVEVACQHEGIEIVSLGESGQRHRHRFNPARPASVTPDLVTAQTRRDGHRPEILKPAGRPAITSRSSGAQASRAGAWAEGRIAARRVPPIAVGTGWIGVSRSPVYVSPAGDRGCLQPRQGGRDVRGEDRAGMTGNPGEVVEASPRRGAPGQPGDVQAAP